VTAEVRAQVLLERLEAKAVSGNPSIPVDDPFQLVDPETEWPVFAGSSGIGERPMIGDVVREGRGQDVLLPRIGVRPFLGVPPDVKVP
jgi:hypothetical protein